MASTVPRRRPRRPTRPSPPLNRAGRPLHALLCYREADWYRVAAVFSTTAQRWRGPSSRSSSRLRRAASTSAGKGIFYVESWAASSQADR